jgi:hypothetical protein
MECDMTAEQERKLIERMEEAEDNLRSAIDGALPFKWDDILSRADVRRIVLDELARWENTL